MALTIVNEQVSGQKKSRAKARLKVSNREASNRVDRSHSENPDDWITLMKIQPNPLLIG